MIRARDVATALLLGLVAACTGGPTDAGRAAPLDIAPSFQVDPSLFTYDPIDRIRLVARDAATSQVVGSSNDSVDPASSQWTMSLAIDLGDQTTIDVIVDVELLSQNVVQWSGRVGPIAVPMSTPRAQGVSLFRGSLDNLDVLSLTIQDGPSQLLEGATATVSATPTLTSGSDVIPEIFWASSDPSVATVSATGGTATVTAVSAGTATIIATSGAAADEFTLEVVASLASVTVSPSTATIVGVDGSQQFTASVTDDLGNPDPNAVVTWSSTNTSVATVDTNGLATSVGVGTTQIVATSGSVSGQATLNVQATGAPGQKLWVGGVSTDWQTDGNWNPPGVPGTGDDVVIPVDGIVSLSADAAVASLSLNELASLDLGGFTLTVSGDVDASSLASNGLVVVTGAGSVLQGFFDDLEVSAQRTLTGYTLTNGSMLLNGAALDVNGQSLQTYVDLTVQGGQLAVNGGSVFANGDLLVTGAGATLSMTVANSAVYVDGDMTFDGGDETDLLTEGTMQAGGNFTATSRSATGFVSSGNHQFLLVGTGARTVSFANPGAAGQRFNDFQIASIEDVTFPTGAYMTGNAAVYGSMVVPTSSTVAIEGALTLYSGSTFDVDGTVDARGGCTDLGAYITGTGTQNCGTAVNADRTWVGGDANGPADWQNDNNWDPVGVPTAGQSVAIPYRAYSPVLSADAAVGSLLLTANTTIDEGGFNLTVSFDVAVDGAITNGRTTVNDLSSVLYGFFDDLQIDAPRALTGAAYVQGALDVNADLDLGANTAFVNLDLTVKGAGRLILLDPAAGVYVFGNADFSGASTAGYWTAGVLVFAGNLTATDAVSPQSFAPTGTQVYLDGQVDQTVVFTRPTATEQRFADLFVSPTSGAKTYFETGMVVTGSLYASNATLVSTGGPMEVQGTLNLNTVTFDDMPLRLVSTSGPTSHAIFQATFTNMPAGASQLYVEIPAGPNTSLLLDTPTFTAPPTGGGYYIEAIEGSGTGALLSIQLNNPTPASSGGFTKLVNATVNGW